MTGAPSPRRSPIALFVALIRLILTSAVSPGAAAAGDKIPSDKLKKADKAVFWTGVVGSEDAGHGAETPVCEHVTCDHFQLEIKLPANTFSNANRPGGVQIAVRWIGEFDTLNLYVFKDGLYRGSSAMVPEAEAALRADISWTLTEADEHTVERLQEGSRLHAVRREEEMAAAAEMLRSLDLDPLMAEATRAWLARLAQQTGHTAA